MKRIFDAGRSVSPDADLIVAENTNQVEGDLLHTRTRDGAVYQAWDFDPVDRAIVDDISY